MHASWENNHKTFSKKFLKNKKKIAMRRKKRRREKIRKEIARLFVLCERSRQKETVE